MKRAVLASIVVLSLAGAASAADRVELKSGSVFEGTIESETDAKIVLRVGTETRELPRSLIASVTRDTSAAAETQRTPAPKPASGTDTAGAKAPTKTETPAPAPQTTGSGTTASEAPAPSTGPVPEPAATEEEPAVADSAIAAALGSTDTAKAAKAAAAIVAGWPTTLPTLKVAMANPSAPCRREALLLIQRENLKGAESLVVKAARDAEASVRLLAIRAMRADRYVEHEALLVSIFSTDAELGVRHECLRTLEVIGTVKCLAPVLESFAKTEAPDTRRRHLRVLKTITGKDAKEDVDAWREIIRTAALDSHLKK